MAKKTKRFDWMTWAIGLGTGLLFIAAQHFGWLAWFDYRVYDFWFRLRPGYPEPSHTVSLIAIDDDSITALEQRWPWPREYWGVLQMFINEPQYRPAVVLYDLVFDQADIHSDRNSDRQFADQMAATGNAMIACQFIDADVNAEHDGGGELPSEAKQGYDRFALTNIDATQFLHRPIRRLVLPFIYRGTNPQDQDGEVLVSDYINTPIGIGFTTTTPDSDGVVRRFPLVSTYEGKHYPALPLLAAAHFLGAGTDDIEVVYGERLTIHVPGRPPVTVPIDEHGAIQIDYRTANSYEAFNQQSFWKVFDAIGSAAEGATAEVELTAYKDKIVIIGSTATSATDLHSWPLDRRISGFAILAHVIENILEQRTIRTVEGFLPALIIVLLAVLTAWATRVEWIRPMYASLGVLVVAGLFLYLSYWLFRAKNTFLPTVFPLWALATSHTGVVVYRHWLEERLKAQIKNIFGRIVSQGVMDELLVNPEAALSLGGTERHVAIVFTDIKGYTAMSENLAPPEVVALLNEYFTDMVDIVLHNEGTLDKYVGDAMMLLFGAPKFYPDPAAYTYLAVRCAIQMQEKMRVLQANWKAAGRPEIHMRVGVNYGEVVVGLIGSVKRAEFTVIGDNVNLASRLESNAPVDGILIGESVYNLVKDRVITEKMPPIKVKNKAEPVQTYVVYGLVEQGPVLKPAEPAEPAPATGH